MADASRSPDSRHSIPDALRISPVRRDARGPENLIPLSPQWLLSKPGENKTGVGFGEDQLSPVPAFGSNHLKYPTASEEGFDFHKKRDVFRPSLVDMESGRRDRWRDEERDTNASIRRDNWRNADKDLGESRRMERWADHNSAGKNYESRRPPSDRRNEVSHREVNYDQRRESKWNTRWGPDDKELDAPRDKWMDLSNDNDFPVEKGSGLSTPMKDEKESDNYRPWRLSTSHNRGRGEPLHHQAAISTKQMPSFSYNRGRGESPPAFSLGRARPQGVGLSMRNITTSQTVGNFMEKGESYPLQYSRAKLLFVYKTTDMNLQNELVKEFVQVASLTQEEPVSPFALCAPNADEADVLDGIGKGEILSSGNIDSQISKDGSLTKNPADPAFAKRVKPAGKEDGVAFEDSKEEITERSKPSHGDVVMGLSMGRQVCSNDIGYYNHSDVTLKQQSPYHVNDPSLVPQWQSSSLQNQLHPMAEGVSDSRPHSSLSGSGWSDPSKNLDVPGRMPPINNKDVPWKPIDNFSSKRQLSSVIDKLDRSYSVPPENLILYYKDPQDAIQGPFPGSDIIGWFESGYFGLDLKVRSVTAPKEAPFLELGDVMPHLRSKAGPPPGFDAVKQSELFDHIGKQPFTGFPNPSPVLNNVDTSISNLKSKSGSSTEAENRFLESLMTGANSNSLHGLHGFNVNSSVGLPSPKVDGISDPYLAKRMALENQRSLPNSYPFWPGKDAIPIGSLPDVVSPLENQHQLPNYPAHNFTSSWPKLSAQNSLEQVQEKPDFLHLQNMSVQPSILQQRMHNPIPNVLTDLHPQSLDSTSNFLTPEKMLALGLPPDPQVLTMLQQQYLLQQLQTQSAQPMSLLDKLFLLKQQQKQEEQNQLLKQHQQQLLSQALSDHRSQLPVIGLDAVNVSADVSRLSQPSELNVPTAKDYTTDIPPQLIQNYNDRTHIFGVDSKQNWEPSPQEQMGSSIEIDSVPEASCIENTVQQQEISHSEQLNPELVKHQMKNEVLVVSDHVESVEKSSSDQDKAPPVKQVSAKNDKKTSEKKSKKQKSGKSAASALPKPSPPVQPQQMFMEEACDSESQFESFDEISHHLKDVKLGSADEISPKASFGLADSRTVETHLPQCAWKPAPGFRAKSIVEIQQEEQMKTQNELPVSEPSSITTSTPWTGIVGISHSKQKIANETSSETLHDPSSTEIKKKSQLHDLFSGEAFPKNTAMDIVEPPAEDEQFIEAKETRKGRKKSNKTKAAGVKLSVSPSVDVSGIEKSKNSRGAAQEKEVLPAAPSGPSLGDFVVWKGEPVNQSSSLAWSTDSKKISKPTSLRDIQKEQEKVCRVQPPIQIPTPKQQIIQGNRGGASSWTPASSPSKPTALPATSISTSHSNLKVDDELFWGPSDQAKQDTKQSEFPDLTSPNNWANKTTPAKSSASASISKQKSSASSPVVKGKKDTLNKHSEAMDFRDWCETECERLIGSKDTSFLEFCLAQSRSEAELFLTENLGSYDPHHKFIDKFLNYKELLSADVLEIAFGRSQNDRKPVEQEIGGSKKKGKKGKKVNPSVLGFNVVSNRIMMGEIQSIEE